MKLFLIDQGELKEVNKPIFSTGDVYLVDAENTIYVWIGNKCSVDEKTSGAAQARTLDQERGGAAKIITVDQGQETQEFLKLINTMGAMKIVNKNLAKTMLKDVLTGEYAGFTEHKNVLYRVSSEEFEGINTMKMIQVPYSKDSLDSEDCFVLDLGTNVYIWQGKACNVKEKVKAGQWARQIDAERAGAQNEVIFDEDEDAEFLNALSKGEDYKESAVVQLRAESELEPETEAEKAAVKIEPEKKAVIKEAAPVKPKEEKPPIKPKEEKPPVKPKEEKPPVKPKEEKPPVKPKEEKPPVKPKEEKPPVKPKEEAKEKVVVAPKVKTEISSSAAPGIPGQADESVLMVEKMEGRRKCPKCHNDNKTLIYESVDKTNIILDYPRMYGKKYKCGLCKCVWREK